MSSPTPTPTGCCGCRPGCCCPPGCCVVASTEPSGGCCAPSATTGADRGGFVALPVLGGVLLLPLAVAAAVRSFCPPGCCP